MECPKCKSAMAAVRFGGVEVDKCTTCRGIWFDWRELERLKHMQGSAQIDSAPTDRTAELDRATDIDCPRCGRRLRRVVDRRQRHVWCDACDACRGVFLDAGEFRDLKEHTITEWLRNAFVSGEGD